MPIWLRKFTFKKIQEHYEGQNKKNQGNSTDDINEARNILQRAKANDPRATQAHAQPRPQVNVPDFVTSKGKASKK